jgi:hypothetical protein
VATLCPSCAQVPVATGGERLRMRLALPDGTKVTCTYNTRVTSEVRGKIVVLRPDFTEIIATDSPLVEPTKVKCREEPRCRVCVCVPS